MKHDCNLRFTRLFQLAHSIHEPGAISVSAKAEGIILDFEPIETASLHKQRGKLFYRLGFVGLEERMHLDPGTQRSLATLRGPDACLNTSFCQSLGKPIRIIADTVKIGRESCAEKAESQSKLIG